MRRLFLLVPVLVALACATHHLATTVTPTGLYASLYSETQACDAGFCSGSAPTSNATGASLSGVESWRLRTCAASGQTLSGAGSMQIYLCDAASRLCYRNTGLDQTVSASGVQCAIFPDFKAAYITDPADTVEAVASGVTVSGGAALTVEIQTSRHRPQ